MNAYAPAAALGDFAPAPARWSMPRALVIALALSALFHFAVSFWPIEPPASEDSVPLTATLTELPPPPVPKAAAPAPAKPKPRRASPVAPVATPQPVEPAPPPAVASGTAEAEPSPAPAGEAVPAPVLAEAIVPAEPPLPPPAKTLPQRVDLAYKVFLGADGFHVGNATYRFEHADNRYRMFTVAQARGLAALLVRGQARMESRGIITPTGLLPHELVVERFNNRGVETALFDWEAGIVALGAEKSEPLEMPTFDPLAMLWQFYFVPPEGAEQSFHVATTRRVDRYTITRDGAERIGWTHGEVETERWHRRSNDGKTDAYLWLAPALRYLPIKMRVTRTDRGTIEAVLDAIRVAEADQEARE